MYDTTHDKSVQTKQILLEIKESLTITFSFQS